MTAGIAFGRNRAQDSAMANTRSEVLAESRRKGVTVGVATAATVTLGVLGAPVVLVAVAAVPTAVLGWRWWKHRSENGIKF
jgi:hypothetical protein